MSAIEGTAAHLAGVLRTAARTRSRFDRRMAVLGLLHRDPQLLVETVLALADEREGVAHGLAADA